MFTALYEVWATATAVSALPEPALTGGALAVGTALTLQPHAWRVARHGLTLVHEASHAAVGLCVGRRVVGIRLNWNTSGTTTTTGKPRGFGRLLTTAAGYPGPGVAAVGIATLTGVGRPALALALVAVASALVTVMSRNLWGLLVAATATALAYTALTRGGVQGVALGTTALAALLAAGSLRCCMELAAAHGRRGELEGERPGDRRKRSGREQAAAEQGEGSDADTLAAIALLPARVWVALFGAICAVSCWAVVGALTLVPGPAALL